MRKSKIIFIGTSNIIHHHILAAKQTGLDLYGICSTRKKSSKITKLKKKYKFKKTYNDVEAALKDARKQKDIHIVIAVRIQDNFKVLKKCLENNTKAKILTEKPISCEHKKINKIIDYDNRIFVGYNRIYYRTIKFLKEKLKNKKNLNILVGCPEQNKENIFTNSCHIFSILFNCFGELKLILKSENTSSINCLLKDKKGNNFYINFNFKASENFSIQVHDRKYNYLLKPIEKLTVFKGMEKKKINNQTLYTPTKKRVLLESYDKKPGFVEQYKNFKKFIENKKCLKLPLRDAYKIIKIISSICN